MDSLIIGGAGGIVRVLVGFPFDQVKIYMQSHRDKRISIANSIKNIYSKEGLYGFYHGSALSFSCSTFQMSLNFWGKGAAENYAKENGWFSSSPFIRTFISGMVGGALHALTVTPVDHLRIQQLWLEQPTLTATLKKAELRYLFHGAPPALMRDGIGMGFFFSVYENMQIIMRKNDISSFTGSFLSGSLAGISWWGSTYPFDVVKTLMQKNPTRYPTMISALSVLNSELGWKGFYRGLSVCLYRAAIVNASVLSATEMFRPFVLTLLQ